MPPPTEHTARRAWGRRIRRWILTCVGVYGSLVALLFALQRNALYVPRTATAAEGQALATGRGLVPWTRADGRQIGWKPAGQDSARYRMLVFQGNAGSALDRATFVRGFERLGWKVVLLEYPGYGARPGAPTQTSLTEAGLEALDQLRREDERPVYLLGESLGSGVATQVARQRPDAVRGLFLVTPFSSMADVAADRFAWAPARLLLRDRWASGEALRDVRGPVAVLLAGQDVVVPTRFGQALFDGYAGPKRLWVQPDRGHNTLDLRPEAALWREVSAFLTSAGGAPRD